jgi:AcrR family transcriptional regulator
MSTTPGPADIRIGASRHPGLSFLEEVDACCLRVLDAWLGKREVKSGVPAKVMARIIDTVQTLILKPVYSEIRMKQIAQIARVTEGTIYRLFGNRARLTESVRRHILARIAATTSELVATRGRSGFTMRDVAVRVGLPEDELRFLFPSLELLLEYAAQRSWNLSP